MAPFVDDTGKVLAVDVQDAMLQVLKQRAAATKVRNVEVIKVPRQIRTFCRTP